MTLSGRVLDPGVLSSPPGHEASIDGLDGRVETRETRGSLPIACRRRLDVTRTELREHEPDDSTDSPVTPSRLRVDHDLMLALKMNLGRGGLHL
jgi:hypothetical protein